ncbi:hypothetical protein C1J03_05320 [Sulfitobacter sp. SK012]|uniref:tetratricopeptide repeat protein n=1 Tax=Sulfitobacter sp. SK012 TaxID=1389005 RepID=UPI000E0BD955|nr:tetratricopeptide repeat protein [Sulfitobacter sp. SK012]AXI45508.1 hypothetical protein C1J03_05320 [Sulfitobacter sp. SK012]
MTITQTETELLLDKIASSQVFSGAERLQEFLRYVVVEAAEGRSAGIKGKTIALDVYGRSVSSDGDPENVVRVDARRLRRRLGDYYEAEGQDDAIRIHIDSGGYAPRFELNSVLTSSLEDEALPPEPQRIRVALAVVCGALILLGLYAWGSANWFVADDTADLKKFERQALMEKSPTSLQAVNLAEQGREMIFPLFDIQRQKLAFGMFEEAIRLDPEYFGGHAGAAQSLGTMAILSQDQSKKDLYLEQASEEVKKATSLNPTQAWTQVSSAWVAFAKGDFDRALELSRRAYALDPDDWYILDLHGLIAFSTGNFAEAQKVSDPSGSNDDNSHRSDSRNIYAVASFHLGEYQKTLKSFQEIGELGGPIGPPRLAYQAAAKHALGDMQGARNSASELMETWPDFRVDLALQGLFEDKKNADDVIRRLRDSGWEVPE